MARQLTYDPIKVRGALLAQFWQTGYAETSLADLEQATGLNRRQLYNGPGDKKAMFLAALDDFTDTAATLNLAPLEAETAGSGEIAALLRRFVQLAASPDGPNGCMMCSTSQEEIAQDADVRPRIEAFFDRIEAAYRNALFQASRRGELTLSEREVEAKGTYLFGVHVAMCILARAGCAQDRLHRMAEEAISTCS